MSKPETGRIQFTQTPPLRGWDAGDCVTLNLDLAAWYVAKGYAKFVRDPEDDQPLGPQPYIHRDPEEPAEQHQPAANSHNQE